jgi:hypothetical protein
LRLCRVGTSPLSSRSHKMRDDEFAAQKAAKKAAKLAKKDGTKETPSQARKREKKEERAAEKRQKIDAAPAAPAPPETATEAAPVSPAPAPARAPVSVPEAALICEPVAESVAAPAAAAAPAKDDSSFTDKWLTCVDCTCEFNFTATEQRFFHSKGFAGKSRCNECTAAKKARFNEPAGHGAAAKERAAKTTCYTCGVQGHSAKECRQAPCYNWCAASAHPHAPTALKPLKPSSLVSPTARLASAVTAVSKDIGPKIARRRGSTRLAAACASSSRPALARAATRAVSRTS